jgi:hypothetical protein
MVDNVVLTICAVFLIVFGVLSLYVAKLLRFKDQVLDMVADTMDQSYERGFKAGWESHTRRATEMDREVVELYPFRIAQESQRIET